MPPRATLIAPNGIVRSVDLLQRTKWYTWLTVWPVTVAFIALCVMSLDPPLVWGKVTYLIWMKYIDFFHGVMFPVLIIGGSFFALLTVWSTRIKAALLFRTRSVDGLVAAANTKLREGNELPPHVNITHVYVKIHPHKGEDEILPLRVDSRGRIYFNFQRRKWTFNAAESQKFEKPIFPTKRPFAFYESSAGVQTDAARDELKDAFGANELTVEIPTFMELFVDHAFAPFFVFQMFCVLLWCLDEYWYYSIFTGIMMIALECLVVMQRLRNMRQLQQMSQIAPNKIDVWRNKKYIMLPQSQLLPLDVVSIPMNAACPADVLLVSGTCVVNESMLTGESTPQMKECIPSGSNDALSSKRDARHILFAGTQVLLSSRQTSCTGDGVKARSPYPCPPLSDNAIGVVLRIGLETKQGRLVRTIWHSQSRVSQSSGEAFVFIGFLLLFAIAAVAYVLRRDLGDHTRSRWKLFLTSTQILTSVVPPELPMELALAVNTSLMALVKLRVFCTEPYRIPFAGKVDTCCFDKTGTLTTDEMLFCGVDACDARQLRNKAQLIPTDAEEVLASCHSLVGLDPAASGHPAATSQPVQSTQKDLTGDAMEKAAVEALGWKSPKADFLVKEIPPDESSKAQRSRLPQAKTLTVLVRFPFLPALKRMSCVVSDNDGRKFVVCKGAAEVIKQLLQCVPPKYDEVCRSYTKDGLRVIALGVKPLVDAHATRTAIASMSREDAESELRFTGFGVFRCPLKADSRATIVNLQAGSHRCVIITGDSLDTAVAVAQDVSIAAKDDETRPLLVAAPSATGESFEWVKLESAKPTKVTQHSSLCVNAEALSELHFAAICNSPLVCRVAVWARCAPGQKEAIVTAMKARGRVVLMAGDGTNDVGGLKQAHVGIAVLNSALLQQSVTATAAGKDPLSQAAENFSPSAMPPDPGPNAGFRERMAFEFAKAKHFAELKQKQRLAEAAQKQSELAATARQQAQSQNDQLDAMAKSMFNEMDDIHGAPMVKLGDASIAAPFTCKSKKMESICDIVRLGRCTLATTVQMYKILALNCLVSAYTLSVLYSDGVRFGDKQMVFSGMIIAACFLLLSRSKPVETLSRERPIATVFHPYIIVSILGQFAVHLTSLIQSVQLVSAVDSDAMAAQRVDVDNTTFKPTLLNSILFLMTTMMTVLTFVVNYCGRPFMTGLFENKPLIILMSILFTGVACCALELDREVNDLLEIVEFPSDEFRSEFVRILVMDAVGSFVVELVSGRIFGRFAKSSI